MSDISIILRALERVSEGDMAFDELAKLMEEIPRGKCHKLIAEALHQSYHYLADRDLRDKDPEYDRWFRGEITGYISSIRELDLS